MVAAQSSSGIKGSDKSIPPSNLKRSLSQDSVYTIVIRLPAEGADTRTGHESGSADKVPSIKMFAEDSNSLPKVLMTKEELNFGAGGLKSETETDHFAIRSPHQQYEFNNRIPMNAKIVPKKNMPTAREKQQQKQAYAKKKKTQEKRQETKAAKTLSGKLFGTNFELYNY